MKSVNFNSRPGIKLVSIPLGVSIPVFAVLCISPLIYGASGRKQPRGVVETAAALPVSVAIVPTSATPATGQPQQFMAVVRNSSNTAVNWKVNGLLGGGGTVGTITSSGLYTAPSTVPAPATVSVTAVSQVDMTKSASAMVTITPPQTAVTISPGSALVQPLGSQPFSATVKNASVTGVIWEVNGIRGGNSTVGTITPAGLYSAPALILNPAIVIVTAISKQNPSAAANATISIGTGPAYYVSTTGSDNNNGSSTTPWRTIQHAANSAVAGNTVYVRGGVYNEVVTLPSSGSAVAGYITFQSYPGETAIVDGTGLPISGTQYGLFTIKNQSYLVISGFEIRNYVTNNVTDTPIGIYINGADSYIQILGNRIHDIITTAKGCNANALGMAVYGNSAPASINNLTISGNEIDHLTTGCSETLSLNGNVDTWSVTNNLIHDNNNIGIDAIGFEGVSTDPAYDQARHGLISGNIVYNITSYDNPAYGPQYSANGIYVDGGTQITIERNLVRNVDIGIEMASEHLSRVTSYITTRSNLVYNTNSVGISIGGYASTVGGTDHCAIVGNTLYKNDRKNTGSGEFQIQWHATNNVFQNNILNATSQGLFVNNCPGTSTGICVKNVSPNPASVDYNLYFSFTGASGGTWVWNGYTYTGFSQFQSSTGQDGHSNFANPLFANNSIPELWVQTSSPAVDSGNNNLGAAVVGTSDFPGNARVQGGSIDIGAYQQP